MSLLQWTQHIFPVSQIQNHESLIGRNICEISVVGSFLGLIAICFLRYGNRERVEFRWPFVVFFSGFLLTVAWEIVPIPSWAGMLFLWHTIHPYRMGYLSGLLLLPAMLCAIKYYGLRFSPLRAVLFCSLVIGGWYYFKYQRGLGSFADSWLDLLIILSVCMVTCFARALTTRGALVAALSVNVFAFGGFNPLQSTRQIFEFPKTETTVALDALVRKQGGALLAVPHSYHFIGATLAGWGYPSISQAFFTPPLEFMRRYFPEMPDEKFNFVFNRSAHINVLDSITEPVLINETEIGVPLKAFDPSFSPPRGLGHPIPAQLPPLRELAFVSRNYKVVEGQTAGYIDSIVREGNQVTIRGWGPWKKLQKGQRLVVLSDRKVTASIFNIISRPDVAAVFQKPEWREGGFELSLTIFDGVMPELCMVVEEEETKEAFIPHMSGSDKPPSFCSINNL